MVLTPMAGIPLASGQAAAAGNTTLPISQSFDSDSPSNWDFFGTDDDGGQSHTAASNVQVGTNNEPSLLLTDNDGNQAGTGLYTSSFSSSNGITAEFRYYANEGSGADGFTFFLLDESDISGGFDASDIGDSGGALGYGDTGSGGITGGFLGVGFDEWGNFDEATYSESAGGDQEITIRGSTDTTKAPVVATNDLSSNTVDGGWRRVKITVDPTAGTSSQVEISVYVDFNEDGSYTEIFSPALYDLATDIDEESGRMPSDLRLGFSGSTGGSTNIHAIDDLTVTKPSDLTTSVTSAPANAPYEAGDTVEYTFDVTNNGPNDDSGVTLDPTVTTGASGLESFQWDTNNDDAFDDDTGDTTTISLNSGETQTVQLRATVGDSATGNLDHEIGAVTSADNNDPSPGDANASVAIDLNDAPSFASGDSLSSIEEDVDSGSNSGAQIDSNELFGDEFSDSDGDTFAGVVVTDDAATSSEGTWQYSTDGGSTWYAVDDGSVATSNGLAVPATADLRFDPAADYSGTPGSLTVHAVDDAGSTSFTSGSTRQTVDTTADGAASDVSSAGVSAGITVTAVDDAPTMSTSSGSSSYTNDGNAIVVDDSLTVSDPDGGPLDGANVSIGAGFVSSEDSLSFDGSVATNKGVSGSYDSSTGVLTFTGTASPADYEAVLRTVTYDNSEQAPDTADRSISFSLGSGSLYSPDTGHYYEFVSNSGIDWDVAKTEASGKTYFGLEGYLVTVTSAAENDFVAGKLSGEGWIGASDRASEGTWRWVTGPEGLEDSGNGRHFFTQTASDDGTGYGGSTPGGGDAVDGEYNNWASNEPNDYETGEDRAHYQTDGAWNDYPNAANGIEGYVVEYGGMPNDPSLQLTDDKTVTVADDPPSISSYAVSNPSSQDVQVSFDSTDQLSTISVSISGAESATLTLGDFTETDNGGSYTYVATHAGSTDGDYTATLDTAADAGGNDGSSGESETVGVYVTAPTISNYAASNPANKDVKVSFDSTDQLSTLQVSISGAESATLTLGDFSETDNGDGTYTYTSTYAGSVDGTYTVALDTASDAGGNDGAGSESEDVVVDTGVDTVEAGSDQTVTAGTSVTLDGSGSSDANGITAYRWDFNDDGEIDAKGTTVDHDFFAVGEHTVRLTVVDGGDYTASDTLTVTVTNTSDWPSFHGNAANLGHNANGTKPTTPVEEVWQIDLDSYVVMNPALVDGTIYFGEYRGKFLAIDASDGSTEWSFDPTQGKRSGGYGWSSPTVKDGIVYIGDKRGVVYAVDADTGTKQWEYDTSSYRIESAPAVVDGTVYVGDSFGTLHALDASTGSLDWEFKTADNARYHSNNIESNPAVVDDVVYFANDDGHVFAVNASNGNKVWKHELGNWTQSDPTVTGNTVYIGDGSGNVYALNASDGSERWQHELISKRHYGGVESSPAFAGGTLYVTDERGTVTALDAADGSEVWQQETGDTSTNRYYYRSSIYSAPIVVDGTVYVTQTEEGTVYAFDADDGTQEWAYDSDIRYLYATPVVEDGMLYYGGYKGFAALGQGDDPPTADAGTSITTPEDAEIQFDASKSTDDNGISTYSWDFGDGAAATGATATHSYSDSGEYTARVVVTDSSGQTDRETVSVTVTENSVLIADAGGNVTADEDTSVAFDASASESNEGIASYSWDFDGDGTEDATGATPSHTFDDPGTYTVTVTLTDQEGNEATDTLRATIADTTDPSADAGSDLTVDEDATVTFDAGASTDNGAISNYQWSLDGGRIVTGQRVTQTFDTPGTYNVTLSVADADGNIGTDTVDVTVTDTTPPRANAGNDVTAPEDGDVSFDATDSVDNDEIDAYAWDFDGDGTTDATGATTTHTYGTEGTYDLLLVVTDEAGLTATDTVTVTVTDTSVLVADAGANLTAGENVAAEFDASGATASEGGLTYSWDFDGDGTEDATGVTPTHTFTSVGTQKVTVTFTDAEGTTATDSLWVTVTDTTAPTADAGSKVSGAQGASVSFDASSSTDAGTIASYQWDFDGDWATDATGASASHTYDEAGTYTAEVVVTDAAGNVGVDTRSVTVTDSESPVANAGSNATSDEDTSVRLTASRSTDNVGITSYEWDFDGDGSTDATGESATHRFSDPGTYTVTLTVTDAAGNTATDTLTATVLDTTAPVADAGGDLTADEDDPVTFDASASTDNGNVVSYEWDVDSDGTTDLTGVSPTHTWDSPGTKTVTLTVTDDDGNSHTDTISVAVADTTAPSADAGSDRTVAVGQSVSFDASGSSDNDGIARYDWDFQRDGSNDATGETVSHTYTETGTYQVRLQVRDDSGNTGNDVITVTVADMTAPVADAGADQSVELNASVTLDGGASSDDTNVTGYTWDVDGDGSTDAIGVSPTHRFTSLGEHTVRLTVSDAAGNEGTDTVTVTVADTTAPTLNLGRNLSADENQPVTLDGSSAADNGQIAAYAWEVDGDGVTDATGPRPNYTFNSGGTYTVELTVTDAAGNEVTDTITVAVAETYGRVSAPATHAIGSHSVNTTTQTTVAITNDGGDTLNVSGLRVTGDDATAFALDGPTAVSIAPGETHTVTLTYHPTAPGEAAASLDFETNDPDSATATVPLSAEATAPELSVTSETLALGHIGLNDSVQGTVTVRNTGTEPLTVQRVSLAGAGAFTLAGDHSGVTIAPGASHEVAVTFAPETAGELAGTLAIGSDGFESSSVTVDLTGTGVDTPLSVSTTSQAFGTVSRGETTTRTLTLSNALSDSVALASLSVTGPNASAFDVEGASSVPGDGDATVTVTFAPTAAQAPDVARGTLALETATGDTLTVALSGTVGAPEFSLAETGLSFETVAIGDTAKRTVTLQNTGTESATVTGLSLTGSPLFTLRDDGPITLGAGDSRTLAVAFVANRSGAANATLVVETDDPATPTAELSLSADARAPQVSVSSRSLGYGNLTVGETVTRTVTIANPDSAPVDLTIRKVSVVGRDAQAFDGDVDGPVVLAPGESVDVPVSLSPDRTGRKMAALRVITNAPGDAQVDVWLSNLRTTIVVEEATDTAASGPVDADDETTTADDTPAQVNVRGERVPTDLDLSINVSQPTTRERSVGVDTVDMRYAGSENFTMNITHTATNPSDTSPDYTMADTGTDIQYVQIDHSFTNEEISETSFRVTVRKSRLEAQGVTASDVSVARYGDGWNELETELVGETASTYVYEVTTPGFSLFALAVPRPSIGVTDLSLSATSGQVGNEVDATATIANDGGASGTYEATLERDGRVVASETVTVAAYGETTVTFEQSFADAGEYTLRVGDQTAAVSIEAAATDPDSTDADPTPGAVETDAPPAADSGVGLWWLLVLAILAALGGFLVLWRRRNEETDDDGQSSGASVADAADHGSTDADGDSDDDGARDDQ